MLKLQLLVCMFHEYVPCSKVTLLSVSVSWICALLSYTSQCVCFIEMCPVLKVHFLECMFH